MRIRLFQSFASNNSGSYTIVGRFKTAEDAAEVARVLGEICAAHHSWYEGQERADSPSESPLDRLVRAEGLSESEPGRGDDWPWASYQPVVLAVGHQVVVYVAMAFTMPRALGELMYKRGGRVETELVHAHERLAVQISFYVKEWDRPDREEAIERMRQEVAALLPELTKPEPFDDRPQVAPVFYTPDRDLPTLTAVFTDLVEGVDAVQRAAAKQGIGIEVRVQECPPDVTDPLALLRGGKIPVGKARLILWSFAERVRAMKGVREVLGTDLAAAKAGIEDLPKEILVDVDEAYARRAADILKNAGCDAEVVTPARAT